jgi:GNAT superfamily N-acetyltransferase
MLEVAVVGAESLSVDEVLALYESVGWTAYTGDATQLMCALAGSHRVVAAREDERLVGLARAVSDGASIAYLQDVLVHPEVQRSGVGRLLVDRLFTEYPDVRQHGLITDAEVSQRAFYEALGFTEVHDHSPQLRAFVRFG